MLLVLDFNPIIRLLLNVLVWLSHLKKYH
jgi:hypothetical protein